MELNTPSKAGEFQLISDEAIANRILDKILENEYAVVGMDTEAALEMSRFGILCLIQVKKIFLYKLKFFFGKYRYAIMTKFIFSTWSKCA